jgi:hypothetical protein
MDSTYSAFNKQSLRSAEPNAPIAAPPLFIGPWAGARVRFHAGAISSRSVVRVLGSSISLRSGCVTSHLLPGHTNACTAILGSVRCMRRPSRTCTVHGRPARACMHALDRGWYEPINYDWCVDHAHIRSGLRRLILTKMVIWSSSKPALTS